MKAVFTSEIPAPQTALADWHYRPGAFERLTPPWEKAERVSAPEAMREGLEARLRVGLLGPVSSTWTALHKDVSEGGFTDEQVGGPFERWVHRHRFEALEQGSRLEDAIEYKLPLSPLSNVAGSFVRSKLERMFRYRHNVTLGDLAAHQRAGVEPMRIAITGASGLIGRALVPYLSCGGHTPIILTRPGRDAPEGVESTAWDPDADAFDLSALEGVDAVIHLAAAGISDKRWSAARKDEIRDSRLEGTRNLANALARLKRPPKVFVSASGMSFYGDRGDEIVDEDSAPGPGYLAEVTHGWEDACAPAVEAGIRVVNLRTTIVLAGDGGALAKMLPPFLAGVGGEVGGGKQWMSWIAIDDFLDVVLDVLGDESYSGPVNVGSPNPVTNREFTKVLGRVLRRPTVMPVPTLALKALYGEMAEETVLASIRVRPGRLLEKGHVFRFLDLEGALRHVLGR